MKSRSLLLAIFLVSGLLQGQSLRYFEVVRRDHQPTDPWRDSSYMVAASDSALLADIAYELALPLEQRRHINGPIAGGSGGFNHNADFWYSWHSIPNEWQFAEFSVEVCDGRTYSDVESDTAYWINTVGYYCGWAYAVAREVSLAVNAPEPPQPLAEFLPIAPNPVQDEVLFSWTQSNGAPVSLNVLEASGRLSITLPLGQKEAGNHSKPFSTSALSPGMYMATLQVGQLRQVQRFVVAH